jgi:hypothetical protein
MPMYEVKRIKFSIILWYTLTDYVNIRQCNLFWLQEGVIKDSVLERICRLKFTKCFNMYSILHQDYVEFPVYIVTCLVKQ